MAKKVINCPAALKLIFRSAAIVGKIPPTISSTRPTAIAATAMIYTRKFIINSLKQRQKLYCSDDKKMQIEKIPTTKNKPSLVFCNQDFKVPGRDPSAIF